MAFNTYSPKDVLVVVGVVPITGYADGSFVEVDYNEEAYKLVIGADGEATRVKNANESGKITIKLPMNTFNRALLRKLSSVFMIRHGKQVVLLGIKTMIWL